LLQALLDSLEVLNPDGTVQIQLGGLEPTENIGLWFKDGTKPYVWNGSGYVPADLSQSLTAYALKSEIFTRSEIVALFAPGSTETNLLIDGDKIVNRKSYAVKAKPAVNQSMPPDNNPYNLAFGNEIIDTDGIYNPVTSVVTVPVTGVYRVAAYSQFDNNGGVASSMQIGIFLSSGTTGNLAGHTTAVASPPGSRWFPAFSDLVLLTKDDTVRMRAIPVDGTGSGLVDHSTNSAFSLSIVKQLSS